MWRLFVLCAICIAIAEANPTSCVGRCNDPYNAAYGCQCDSLCTINGNCCSDYNGQARCTDARYSCANRCGETYNGANSCHCDVQCANAGNCCDDHTHICAASSDLSAVANEMWYGDWNRADVGRQVGFQGDIIIDLQEYIANTGAHNDLSPNVLMTLQNAGVLDRHTFTAFVDLLNNYVSHTGTAEDVLSGEIMEMDIFMSEIMRTYPMKKAHEYLVGKGLADPDEKAFKQELKVMWFDLYSRSSGPLDSSGFEHVFVGEIKNSAVSGFHNWVQYYLEENTEGTANYYGYTSDSGATDIIGVQFNWESYMKELTSMWIGRSPEFEMGIFTICFLEMPNTVCNFDLAGIPTRVQTWDQDVIHIGTAYPIA